MPGIAYLLCAATSCLCSVLLWRGYRRTGVRLLLWSCLCFAGLTLDNVMMYVDVIVVPQIDLSVVRRLPGLIGMILLTSGLVWESK
jgi:hypothetical protein